MNLSELVLSIWLPETNKIISVGFSKLILGNNCIQSRLNKCLIGFKTKLCVEASGNINFSK